MDWNCTLTEERLSDFLEATLSPAEAAAFSKHVDACDRCSKLVGQVSALVNQMQQSALIEEPPQLARRILDATLGPQKQKPVSQGWFAWVPAILQPRFAMGIVTVAASVLIVFHAAGSPAARTSLSPANLVRGANRQVHLTYAKGAKFVNDLRVVYEIQSRLSSQPDSMSEPISTPAAKPSVGPQPGQEDRQPSTEPHEKSQTVPHSNRRDGRGVAELAIMLPNPFSINSSNSALRSSL
jgi:anti-sigma factor RsiW